MILYDFLLGGGGAIATWRDGLQKRQRVALEEKLDRLEQLDHENARGFLIHGTHVRSIFKLKVRGNVQLRPMLCYGPNDVEEEVTLLHPAVEKDGKYQPPDAAEVAGQRRLALMQQTARRIRYEP